MEQTADLPLNAEINGKCGKRDSVLAGTVWLGFAFGVGISRDETNGRGEDKAGDGLRPLEIGLSLGFASSGFGDSFGVELHLSRGLPQLWVAFQS